MEHPDEPGQEAKGWEDVIDRLTHLAESQDLIQRAMEGYAACWANEGLSDLPFTFADVRPEFRSHSLNFKGGRWVYSFPFIRTVLDLYVGEHQVGDYTLITLLDGEVIDDYFVIFEEYQAGGRAVSLLTE
jgi:hypothetical protein